MKDRIKRWLEKGVIDIFLGYKLMDGHPLPYCFKKEHLEEIDELIDGRARYALEKMATHIAAIHPEIKIGMMARDCNQRALNVLYIWNQLNPDNIHIIKVNCCPSNLKAHADCSYLDPETAGSYKQQVGVDNTLRPEALQQYASAERLSRWMYEFQKCIKCYGCRDICPVCFCKECSLEHPELIGTGALPPETPVFHLVRAVHMAGRCVDCGLCEEACPVDIPLRLLYRKVNEVMVDVFGYETGAGIEQSPFNVLGETVSLKPKPMQAENLQASRRS